MRTSYIPGLAAIAVGVSIVGASAAPMDMALSAGATHAGDTAASLLQPPAGSGLNQKGLAAIQSTGGQLSVSAIVANPAAFNIGKAEAVNAFFSPQDSLENRLSNTLLLSPDKVRADTTNDLLHPPSK
jgi:hypothetical protein